MKLSDIFQNDDPSNIIITLPANIKWFDYQKELDIVANGSSTMRFKVNNLPKKSIEGGRCYLVHKGNIVGWMKIVGTYSGSFTCSTTGKKWEGNFIERSGPFHRITPIPHKGFQGWRYFEKIDEKYTPENKALFDYMKNEEFDPHAHWYDICEWLQDNAYLDEVSDILGEEIDSAESLQDEDPEIFYKLPDDIQEECEKYVLDHVLTNDPASAQTWQHMDLKGTKPLHRQTWLVHFTDDPIGIAHQGFTIGMDRMDNLGLTTWYKNDGHSKKHGGYNFAFEALSRYAVNAANNNKYGKHAVLFQNSGVHAYHYGDEEDQVMFWGKDVDPRDIIVLKNTDYGWEPVSMTRDVKMLDPRRGDGRDVGKDFGNYTQCVQWVIRNFNQYRKFLTRR